MKPSISEELSDQFAVAKSEYAKLTDKHTVLLGQYEAQAKRIAELEEALRDLGYASEYRPKKPGWHTTSCWHRSVVSCYPSCVRAQSVLGDSVPTTGGSK